MNFMNEIKTDTKIDAKELIGCDSLSDIRKYVVIMGDLYTDPIDTVRKFEYRERK